jgi:hypothetical protein
MSYPGPGPIYRHCITCGRPFRVWRCELLRNRAKFCTVRCYSAFRRAFSKALADGRLDHILEMPVSQEVLKTDPPATRRRQAVRR